MQQLLKIIPHGKELLSFLVSNIYLTSSLIFFNFSNVFITIHVKPLPFIFQLLKLLVLIIKIFQKFCCTVRQLHFWNSHVKKCLVYCAIYPHVLEWVVLENIHTHTALHSSGNLSSPPPPLWHFPMTFLDWGGGADIFWNHTISLCILAFLWHNDCAWEWFPRDCYSCSNYSSHVENGLDGCVLLFITNEAILVCAGDLCVSVPSPQLLWFLVLLLPVASQQWQLEALMPQASVHGMQAPWKWNFIDWVKY